MKKDYTHIVMVLDKSSSMGSVHSATIEGVNSFLKSQAEVPGTATVDLVQFNNNVVTSHKHVPLNVIEPLNVTSYSPYGGTALWDAIGKAINDSGNFLKSLAEEDKPEKVIVTIITDGEENSSKEFTASKVKEMIAHQKDKYSWEFVFLGANQDAFHTGSILGIAKGSTMTYASNDIGSAMLYESLGNNMKSYRSGLGASMNFSTEDRTKQQEAGAVK